MARSGILNSRSFVQKNSASLNGPCSSVVTTTKPVCGLRNSRYTDRALPWIPS